MNQQKEMTFRICPEVLYTNSFVFHFPKNFYLVEEFNKLIDKLESAGILEYIITKYVDFNLMKPRGRNTPSVINYNQIEGFFMLFYCGCVLALVSFICELFLPNIKILRIRYFKLH